MLIPATRYRDPEAALRFLTDILELAEHKVYRDAAGAIVHAQLTCGTGMMMFGPETDRPFDAFMTAPASAGGETTTIYAVVADVAGLHGRIARRDAEIVMPLAAQDHGGSSFSVRDPEGHIYTFGDYDPYA